MPASPARQMTAALKRTLVPALERSGFSGTFPRYRRTTASVVHLLMIAYDKEGASFHLEFGGHPSGDKRTSWGEVVPADKILLEHVPFTERARLQARCDGGSVPSQWFRFDRLSATADYDALAIRVAGMMPQVEDWIASGIEGPNISPNAP